MPEERNRISWIKEQIQNQDFTQKVGAITQFTLELYRLMVSSLLILFVPQSCDSHVCSYRENMIPSSPFYTVALTFNFITMGSFMIMYLVEIQREYKLINYLEVNKEKPCDNESVGRALESLPSHRVKRILYLDAYYYRFAIASMCFFFINTILSGFVIYDFYLDNQTTTTYITNILFMITKLSDVYSTIHTEKNIFYSAYLKGKVQYNDVDPEKSESIRHIQCAASKEEIMVEIPDAKTQSIEV